MFSRTAEYALRAVVWLAANHDTERLGVKQIADGTKVPPSYLSKVLQGLSKAGLVSSRRGVGGGHSLTRSPAAITVLEVVDAVEPIRRIDGCPLGLASHRHRLCGMHARLDEALKLVQETLAASTIEDILRTENRPPPMQELHSILPSVPRA